MSSADNLSPRAFSFLFREPKLLIKVLLASLFALGIYCAYSTTVWYIPIGSDFTQDWVAAKQLRAGNSIYGNSITSYALSNLGFDGIENFHPPSLTLFYLPLSFLSYGTANLVLNLLSTVLYLVIILITALELKWPKTVLWYLLPASLFWHPFIEVMALGQSSIVIAVFIVGSWVLSRRNCDVGSGMLLGFATLMKLFPAWLCVYFVLRRRWRSVVGMLSVVAVGALVTVSVVGVEDSLLYINKIAPENSRIWGMFQANPSIRGTVMPFFERGQWTLPLVDSPVAGEVLTLLMVLLCAGVSIFTARSLIRLGESDIAYSNLVFAMFLIAPLCWLHNLPAAIGPISIVALFLARSRRGFSLLIFTLLLLSVPTHVWNREVEKLFSNGGIPPAAFLLTRVGFVGIFLLWASTLVKYREIRRPD